jgi:hypothetical protein
MMILVALLLAQAPAAQTQPPVVSAAAPAVSTDATREQIACAPASLPGAPVAGLRVVGGNVRGRIMFGPGDPLVIDAGTAQGIQNGQRYFVRRYLHDQFTPASAEFTPHPVHTAGWVTVVETRDNMAIATVTHACDGITVGDYLEPFVDPVIPAEAVSGHPDFDHPGRLVMSDEKRQSGAAGMLMLMNRGSDHGVRAGQTVTIYRQPDLKSVYEEMTGGAYGAYGTAMSATGPGKTKGKKGAAGSQPAAPTGPIFDVGRATVLSVQAQTSLVRIDSTRDAVVIGDFVAIHRVTQ